MSEVDRNTKLELMRRTSHNIMQSAEKFETTVKRDKSILINISIDQNEQVETLIKKVSEMSGINMVGFQEVDG